MSDDAEGNVGYGLIVSFPDESASFVNGFEAGALWNRLTGGAEAEISLTTHTENREVIARMADAQGWDVEVTTSQVQGWDFTKLEKTKPARERPNPHGLRLVQE